MSGVSSNTAAGTATPPASISAPSTKLTVGHVAQRSSSSGVSVSDVLVTVLETAEKLNLVDLVGEALESLSQVLGGIPVPVLNQVAAQLLSALSKRLQAHYDREEWLGEFGEWIQRLQTDIVRAGGIFQRRAHITALVYHLAKATNELEQVSSRGKIVGFFWSASDKEMLAARRARCDAIRQEALYSMLTELSAQVHRMQIDVTERIDHLQTAEAADGAKLRSSINDLATTHSATSSELVHQVSLLSAAVDRSCDLTAGFLPTLPQLASSVESVRAVVEMAAAASARQHSDTVVLIKEMTNAVTVLLRPPSPPDRSVLMQLGLHEQDLARLFTNEETDRLVDMMDHLSHTMNDLNRTTSMQKMHLTKMFSSKAALRVIAEERAARWAKSSKLKQEHLTEQIEEGLKVAHEKHWQELAIDSEKHVEALTEALKRIRWAASLLMQKLSALPGVHSGILEKLKNLYRGFELLNYLVASLTAAVGMYSPTEDGSSSLPAAAGAPLSASSMVYMTREASAKRVFLTLASVDSLSMLARALKTNSQDRHDAALNQRHQPFWRLFKIWLEMVRLTTQLIDTGLTQPLSASDLQLFTLNQRVPDTVRLLAPQALVHFTPTTALTGPAPGSSSSSSSTAVATRSSGSVVPLHSREFDTSLSTSSSASFDEALAEYAAANKLDVQELVDNAMEEAKTLAKLAAPVHSHSSGNGAASELDHAESTSSADSTPSNSAQPSRNTSSAQLQKLSMSRQATEEINEEEEEGSSRSPIIHPDPAE